jgi:protein-disulfide isomerase
MNDRFSKEDDMANTSGHRSAFPWITALVVAAVCGLVCLICVLCPAAAAGVYLLSGTGVSKPVLPPSVPPPTATVAFLPSETGVSQPTPEPSATPDSRVSSDPDTWRQAGDPNAKVLVEEFADYQCPYCGDFHTSGEPKLRTMYIQTGKVRFLFRNFPVLDGGDPEGESHLAALAALCAGEQGKFWEYHDLLFENQSGENTGGFAPFHLLGFASDLGLRGSAFDQCVKAKRYESIVDDDLQLGEERAVEGVPTFYINGKTVLGFDKIGFFDAIDQAFNE